MVQSVEIAGNTIATVRIGYFVPVGCHLYSQKLLSMLCLQPTRNHSMQTYSDYEASGKAPIGGILLLLIATTLLGIMGGW